jgi:hypothetical protein
MVHQEKAVPERRKGGDRRKNPATRLQWRNFHMGTRSEVRRKSDPQQVYVDVFGLRDFATVLIVLFLSCLDAAFTIYHLSRGATELNLLMAYALNIGIGYFFILKYSITALGVLILCVHKNFRLIREVFIGIITLYSLLIIYHVILLFL